MNSEQARNAIMHHATATAIDRTARLLDSIKCETRWLLVSTPTRGFRIDETEYATDRKTLVAIWPAIRHRRVKSNLSEAFYDVVADHASLLTHLIEIRRQRSRRAAQQ